MVGPHSHVFFVIFLLGRAVQNFHLHLNFWAISMIDFIMSGRFEVLIFLKKNLKNFFQQFSKSFGQIWAEIGCRRPVVDSHRIPHPVACRRLTTANREKPNEFEP